MDFKDWYRGLTKQEKAAYAERAGTTVNYIEKRLMFNKRVPRRKLMERMAEASLGRVSYDDLIEFFLKGESSQAA